MKQLIIYVLIYFIVSYGILIYITITKVVERSKVFNFFDRCALDPEAGVRYRVAPFRSLFPPLRTQK